MTLGEQISTLRELDGVSHMGRKVFSPVNAVWATPRPACSVMGLPGDVILMLLRSGLFVYEKPKKKKGVSR